MRFNKSLGAVDLSSKIQKNYIVYNKKTYVIKPLSIQNKADKGYPKSKGGNSSVFIIVDPDDEREYIVKFSKYSTEEKSVLANLRFEHEIKALKKAEENGFENVVRILFDGSRTVDEKPYRFYVMEKGDQDLTSYLLEEEIPINQKIYLCSQLIKGINELHSMDLYHRDLKPDNIFVLKHNNTINWKIGDLGLSAYRKNDFEKREFQKKIGPVGWLSPEATNKWLCEGTKYSVNVDCKIDNMSDVFQLGKVMWYVFQNNIPVGQVRYDDFIVKKRELYDLLIKMLQYNKRRRGNLNYYQNQFDLLSN